MSSLFAIRALLFMGECFAASGAALLLLSLAWIASRAIPEDRQACATSHG